MRTLFVIFPKVQIVLHSYCAYLDRHFVYDSAIKWTIPINMFEKWLEVERIVFSPKNKKMVKHFFV